MIQALFQAFLAATANDTNSVADAAASASVNKGKTTILQHLQSMQLSDSSDDEGLSLLSHNNTSLNHNTSRLTTSGCDKTNVVKQEWALILSNPEHAWRWKIVVAVMKVCIQLFNFCRCYDFLYQILLFQFVLIFG